MRTGRFLVAALFALIVTIGGGVSRAVAAPSGPTDADYADVRAHPEDEQRFSAFLGKLPTFEVQQGGVPRLYYVYQGDLVLTRDDVRRAVIGDGRVGSDEVLSPELIVNVVAGRPQYWPRTARSLTYAIDQASFPNRAAYAGVVKAMGEASKAWVTACPDCGLSITHDAARDVAPREGETTFIVRYQPEATGFIALAFFAGDPVEKRYLYVFPPYLRTRYDKVGVFRHELGHILGYRHEQIRPNAGCRQTESGQWLPLSAYDPKSVMHYFCNDNASLQLALSPTDISSHISLYSGAAALAGPIERGEGAMASAGLRDPQPAPSGAEPPAPAREEVRGVPAVHISLVGGMVAKDLARILSRLAQAPQLLPVERVVLAPGDNPTKLLNGRGVPVAGREFEQLLEQINGKGFGSRTLKIGDTIQLPRLVVTMTRSVRTFTPNDPAEQRRKEDLLKRWQTKDVQERNVNGLTRVEFDVYDAVIDYETDKDAQDAVRRLTLPVESSLRSPNVVIDYKPSVARPAKAYSFPSDYSSVCRGPVGVPVGGPPPAPPILGYDELLDNDPDLAALLGELPGPTGKPAVYVVDTKIIPNPALMGADMDIPAPAPAAPPAQWRCNWTSYVEALHHGTHMAGIIASRNGQGFIGLAPTSQVSSFEWYHANGETPPKLVETLGREDTLAQKIDRVTGQQGLSVFLIASEFKEYSPSLLNGDRQLLNTDIRRNFTRAHQAVFQGRPLLIAAAGQSETDAAPVRLSTLSPHAPQGLGDLENVVVVTACTVCKHDKITLMPSAYYGVQPDPVVHLAAPGGQAIPGWVNGDSIGAAPGTSPAAAYTAGVAAAMIARYPALYLQAEQVKRRLQMTAWPILPTANPADDAWTKVAAGLVDYQRAQLDPAQSWVRDANGWRPVKIKRWSGPLRVRGSGGEMTFSGEQVLRLLRVSADGEQPAYALYADTETPRIRGLVQRRGPVTLTDPASTVELCTGSPLKLSDLSELIVATLGPSLQDNPCA